tara:strand:- start:1667 stop:2146 length:480 start_codon:yes stop_codon:yes gene_type:complete
MAIDQITTGIIKDDAVTGAKLENAPTIAGRSVHSGGVTIADGGQIGSASDLDAIAIDASGNVTASQNLTVSGNFTVNGTTTTINAATLEVEDKDITIAKVGSPSDTTANNAGIIIKGASDKTLLWKSATNSLSSNRKLAENAGSSAYQRPSTYALALGN